MTSSRPFRFSKLCVPRLWWGEVSPCFQKYSQSLTRNQDEGLDFSRLELDNDFSYEKQSPLLTENTWLLDMVFNCR